MVFEPAARWGERYAAGYSCGSRWGERSLCRSRAADLLLLRGNASVNRERGTQLIHLLLS
jgi:hypothetical protein